MTVREKIQAVLEAASGVTAFVPTNRIRVPGAWQNLDRPYLIHFAVAADPTYTHSGLAAGRGWEYQVSVFADSYSTGDAVATAVVNALSGVHGDSPLTEGMTVFWEPGTWYAGSASSRADGSGPPIEHFAIEFRIFEGLA